MQFARAMRCLLVFAGFLAAPVHAQTPEKYRASVQALEKWIAEEVTLKNFPSLSLALVDDQTVVWSHSFGHADPERKIAATPDTLYRVGSVSKPFTALLLMIFVEMGMIDLDAPIQDYLPEFQPVNKTGKKITLRQMLCHRSGLVREGPVGNYFDDTEPSLADTVKSLNKTALVFEPGSTTSYSNMALATVGYVLEKKQKEPFAQLMQRKLLDPIGMKDSSFSGQQRTFSVLIDPERLRAYDISPEKLAEAINKSGIVTMPDGLKLPIKKDEKYIGGVTLLRSFTGDPMEVGNIQIKPGMNIYLRDLGKITSGPEFHDRLARATMWTTNGREFPAPTWDFGMGPAGNLISSVNDQAKFLKFLFAGGRGPKGQILKRETLEKMYTIQFPQKGQKAGFGLGFLVGDLDGKRLIQHGGAVYGFATQFAALPDDKLGVIVCASKDVANAVTGRVAKTVLQHMLAVKAGKPLPKLENSRPLDPETARALAGRYRAGKKTIKIYERAGRAWIFAHHAGTKAEIRRLGGDLITDDLHAFGLKIVRQGVKLAIGKYTYEPIATDKPAPLPAKWVGLIGEYGSDYNVLVILEKDGLLHALIEWQFLYPLEEVSDNVYKFPDYGLYMGDKITFARDKRGQAIHADAASVLFKRRPLPRKGETFKIEPVRPVDQLRKIALNAMPPKENNALLRKTDLVDIAALDKTIKLDIRYATANNFLGTPFYTSARAFLQKPAAEALVKAHKDLADQGYGLLIHDAYRPWHVTKMFFDATPARFHHFVADPLQGSRHNRGCAVDLTLYDLKTGQAVDMPGGYDEFSDRSYPDYLGGTSLERWQRDLLRRTMEKHGFTVYDAEWWHFDFHEWRHYPILNVRFEDLAK